MKQSVTVGAQLLWSGRYGCNNGRYGCTIVMSYIEINKAVSQWLLTFNLCVSVTWPLTCAFHIPCTHTPESIDMHRGMCDNILKHAPGSHHIVKSLIKVAPNPKNWIFFVSSCSCLCAIYWSQVLIWEWRCSWSSANRRCSNYIWVINNFIAY